MCAYPQTHTVSAHLYRLPTRSSTLLQKDKQITLHAAGGSTFPITNMVIFLNEFVAAKVPEKQINLPGYPKVNFSKQLTYRWESHLIHVAKSSLSVHGTHLVLKCNFYLNRIK